MQAFMGEEINHLANLATSGWLDKGLLYLFIGIVLLLALLGLNRIREKRK